MISFLTSSGAVKPSNVIQAQDLKIGIPNMLICIEMAIFAVMHMWCFPWRPYTLAQLEANADPEWYSGKACYHGGFLGLKGLLDAFNPWDLIKAIGRGFRWLFVGRKKRMLDPSYHRDQTDKPGRGSSPETSIPGSNVTAYGGAGVVLGGPSRRFYASSSSPVDEEGQELLTNAQPPAASSYPRASTIGLATSLYDDDNQSIRYYSEVPTDSPIEPPSDRPHLYQPFRPYHGAYPAPADSHNHYDGSHHQETGVTSTAEYEQDNMPRPMPMPTPYLPPPLDDHNQQRR